MLLLFNVFSNIGVLYRHFSANHVIILLKIVIIKIFKIEDKYIFFDNIALLI